MFQVTEIFVGKTSYHMEMFTFFLTQNIGDTTLFVLNGLTFIEVCILL